MDNDFNPFDLSAQRPKNSESTDEKKELEKPRPKPIVRRISMGPLFHSRITKVIAFFLSIILAGLLGYVGMNYYINKKAATGTFQLMMLHQRLNS